MIDFARERHVTYIETSLAKPATVQKFFGFIGTAALSWCQRTHTNHHRSLATRPSYTRACSSTVLFRRASRQCSQGRSNDASELETNLAAGRELYCVHSLQPAIHSSPAAGMWHSRCDPNAERSLAHAHALCSLLSTTVDGVAGSFVVLAPKPKCHYHRSDTRTRFACAVCASSSRALCSNRDGTALRDRAWSCTFVPFA